MWSIKINGYEYEYDPHTRRLTLDGCEVDRKFMTPNEKLQLDTQISKLEMGAKYG